MYTHVNPTFPCKKWGFPSCSFQGLVNLMDNRKRLIKNKTSKQQQQQQQQNLRLCYKNFAQHKPRMRSLDYLETGTAINFSNATELFSMCIFVSATIVIKTPTVIRRPHFTDGFRLHLYSGDTISSFWKVFVWNNQFMAKKEKENISRLILPTD